MGPGCIIFGRLSLRVRDIIGRIQKHAQMINSIYQFFKNNRQSIDKFCAIFPLAGLQTAKI